MDKYQPTQNTQDSGIVTRTTSPGFDEDDSSTDEHVMYRWNRATQGAWDSSYPVPSGNYIITILLYSKNTI